MNEEFQHAARIIVRGKSLVVAVLLAMFFGNFGLFYASVIGGAVMTLYLAYGVYLTLTLQLFGTLTNPIVYWPLFYIINITWAITAVNRFNRALLSNEEPVKWTGSKQEKTNDRGETPDDKVYTPSPLASESSQQQTNNDAPTPTANRHQEVPNVDGDENRPLKTTIDTLSPKEDVDKQGAPRFKDDVKDEPIAPENTSQEPILRSKRFFLGVAVGGIAGATSAWFSYEPIKYPAAKTLAQRPNSISLSKPTVPFEKRTADSIIFAFATQGVYYEEGQHYPATMPRTRINVSLTIYSDGYADFSVDNLKGEVVSRSYAYFGTGKDGEKNTYLVFRSLQDPEMILSYNFKEDTSASVNKRTTKGVWVKFESNTFYDRN
jgi:hypothetical protein